MVPEIERGASKQDVSQDAGYAEIMHGYAWVGFGPASFVVVEIRFELRGWVEGEEGGYVGGAKGVGEVVQRGNHIGFRGDGRGGPDVQGAVVLGPAEDYRDIFYMLVLVMKSLDSRTRGVSYLSKTCQTYRAQIGERETYPHQ